MVYFHIVCLRFCCLFLEYSLCLVLIFCCYYLVYHSVKNITHRNGITPVANSQPCLLLINSLALFHDATLLTLQNQAMFGNRKTIKQKRVSRETRLLKHISDRWMVLENMKVNRPNRALNTQWKSHQYCFIIFGSFLFTFTSNSFVDYARVKKDI